MNIHSFGGGNDSIFTLGLNVLGLQDMFGIGQSWNYPGWSLTQFFICWAIYYGIIFICKNKKDKVICLCFLMILIGISLQTSWSINIIFLNGSIARGYVSFFTGGILWYAYDMLKKRRKSQQKVVVGCLIWLLLIFCLSKIGIPMGVLSAVYSICIFPAMLMMILNSNMLNKILGLRPLVFLGEISFSMYLCNYSVEVIVMMTNDVLHLNINASSITFFVCYFIINISFATIIHFTVEKWAVNKMSAVLYKN